MSARFRPIHSSFETLRQARVAVRSPYNSFGKVANEQMTAIGLARTTRHPAQIYADFIQR